MIYHQNEKLGSQALFRAPRPFRLVLSRLETRTTSTTSVHGISRKSHGMRLLLPQAATMWQQASSRLALKLVSFRVLARPFAPIVATVPHVKHLHDHTKKPDSALDKKFKNSPADDGLELEARSPTAGPESASEHAASKALGDDAETPAVQKDKKRVSDAQRAANIANAKKSVEQQRAAGFPNLQKGWDSLRAAGFPNLKRANEINKANGFPNLKKGRELAKATGYVRLAQSYHAELIRNIEAANKRKLAEDPTFIPLQLPDLASRPRVNYSKRPGSIPCPEPGCGTKLATEQSLAYHIRRMHSGYSEETPHKCKATFITRRRFRL
jgi:hypothetical protein